MPAIKAILACTSISAGIWAAATTVIKAMNRYKDKHGDQVQFSILDNGHIAADVIVKKRIGE